MEIVAQRMMRLLATIFFLLGLYIGQAHEKTRSDARIQEIVDIIRSGGTGSTEEFILSPLSGAGKGNACIIGERDGDKLRVVTFGCSLEQGRI